MLAAFHIPLSSLTLSRAMRPRVLLFLGCSALAFLHIMTFVSSTNVVSFAAHPPLPLPGTETESESKLAAEYREIKKMGSRPPDCESKCYGCSPCVAIQVPTTNRNRHFSLQYANYFPEGWKCKCGPSYYSP